MTSNLTFGHQYIDAWAARDVQRLILPSPSTTSALAISISIAAVVMIITYSRTWYSFFVEGKRQGEKGIPRVFPYSLPYVQSALSFGISPSSCVVATTQAVGRTTAFGLRTLGTTLYFLTGRDNIAQIRKHQGQITDPGIQSFCLIRVFGMNPKAVEAYNRDDSGIEVKPASDNTVAPHNRIDFHTHANFVKMLSGDGLNTLFQRWHSSFARRLSALQIGNSWIQGSDIEKFWMSPLTASLNEALAGPILEHVNPDFTSNFIEFLPYVHNLMKGLPKWCMPRAFALRESLTKDTKKWHDIARELTRESEAEGDSGSDRYWGVPTMRERQDILSKVDNWDRDAVASSDFGLLWGANINVHTAALWSVVEIFRDPVLLARVRAELDTVTASPDQDPSAWIEQIMALPLLQSVYAEVLRLRIDVQTVFRDNRQDIHINKWTFPKKSLVLVPTRPAHMDEDYWNTRGGQYPLDRFWADRFLEYPNDPESGPSRKTVERRQQKAAAITSSNAEQREPKFITAGTSDSWIPYGVGDRACPGRFFARREITAFVAIMVKNFEIELPTLRDAAKQHLPCNYVFYGLGVQRPRDKFPFRMRRIQSRSS